jgi:hypothetical protein
VSVRPIKPALQVLPTDAVDLGVVSQGGKAASVFSLRNQGSYPLDIVRVVSSCGCATGTLEKPSLEPGESTVLRTTYAAEAARGQVAAHVVVVYQVRKPEGSEAGLVRVGMRAFVDPDFVWSPEVLEFRDSVAETRSLFVSPNRLSQLEVTEAYCTHKAFHATLTRADPLQQGRYRVDLCFIPEDWRGGPGSAELMVRTNSRAEPVARIALEVTPSLRQ